MPGLEHSGEGRLSVHVKVLSFQKPRCVGAFSYVHYHRPVGLRRLLPAELHSLAIFTSFSFSSISFTLARTLPFSSSTAVLCALSTSTGYHWSRKTREPTSLVFSATSLTRASSFSSRHVMRMRAMFRESLVTATHRQPLPASPSRVLFLTSCLILPAFAMPLSASSTLETSTAQYRVSVKVDGVV